MTEGERYLARARESLASCEADVAAGRANSAANRAYYAAFQAAVAALAWSGVSPPTEDWGHRFVMKRFSVTLTRQRKLLPGALSATLDQLFDSRVMADYRAAGVSQRAAAAGADAARGMVEAVAEFVGAENSAEAIAENGSSPMTTAEYREKASGFVREIEDVIRASYPDSTFEVVERTPKDYRVTVKGSFEDQLAIQDLMGSRKIDMLADHDIWVVVLAEPVEEAV